MHYVLTTSLARRGVQVLRDAASDKAAQEAVKQEILEAYNRLKSPGSIAVLSLTALFFIFWLLDNGVASGPTL